ncbi:hypothetical protein FSZ31_04445 [Sphingorhabdus soli]|uniref:Lysozyme n=1 Tax=Flavisphingopyxis soli TaxID=2601267 RepID=A0A5C6ULW6_9SPHN|nr:glycoside hydrolase family protein [Sphingorhabdus soli]TXC73977.1 hypothetical protein FSZ31_04445 [Sphingorhabdus soli]
MSEDWKVIQRWAGVTDDGVPGPATAAAIIAKAGIEVGQSEATAICAPADFILAATDHLRREEGVRHEAYKDHLGYWTIGVGRLIDERKGGRITPAEQEKLLANNPGRRGQAVRQWVLTDSEVNMLLANDIADKIKDLETNSGLKRAWAKVQGNTPRMVALTSMCFQLGAAGLAGFKNTLGMVADGRFADAANNMLASKWAKQTPARANRIAEMMRTD